MTWEWIGFEMMDAFDSCLMNRKPFYGYGMEETSLGPTDVNVYFTSDCKTDDEWASIHEVAKQALLEFEEYEFGVNITFRPDLDQ